MRPISVSVLNAQRIERKGNAAPAFREMYIITYSSPILYFLSSFFSGEQIWADPLHKYQKIQFVAQLNH